MPLSTKKINKLSLTHSVSQSETWPMPTEPKFGHGESFWENLGKQLFSKCCDWFLRERGDGWIVGRQTNGQGNRRRRRLVVCKWTTTTTTTATTMSALMTPYELYLTINYGNKLLTQTVFVVEQICYLSTHTHTHILTQLCLQTYTPTLGCAVNIVVDIHTYIIYMCVHTLLIITHLIIHRKLWIIIAFVWPTNGDIFGGNLRWFGI